MNGEKRENVNPLLESKTKIPELSGGVVSRKTLVSEIEGSTEEIIVIQAGAGFGKTTAMAELAKKYSGHCGWYQADELDNDPESFLRGICSAISRVIELNIPEFHELGQKADDIAKAYQRFLSEFLLRISEETFYLCINDFQMIVNEQIYRLIVTLIEYGREKIRLVLTVKGSFPKFLAVYLMQGRVIVIGTERLRFGRDETNQLLKGLTGMKLSEKLITGIQEYTAGWPAGIVFAGLGLKDRSPGKNESLFFDTVYLYDYIFYEIFHGLSDDIQMFLTETSVMEEVEPAVCNYVLERSDSAHMLEYLVHENLFLSKGKGAEEYCYHAVFAGFLRDRIQPERKEKIRCRTAEYYARIKKNREEEHITLLQVTCLGGFEVTGTKGKLLWRTRKTKELFACLFFEEGRGIKKDTLMERLWPEASRERASVLFHTTVSYLRKAFLQAGEEEILVVKNQAYGVDFSYIESDIGKLMKISRELRAGVIPEKKSILEVAELYHECYMYGEDYPWLGEYREYVEQVFLQTMEKFSEIQMKRGEFQNAVLLLEKATEVDSYSVSLLELLMECLLFMGDVKGAKRQYTRIKRVCEEELSQKIGMEFQDYVERVEERRREC